MIPIRHLKKYLHTILINGGVPFITGSPGASKSSQVKQYAEKNKLKLVDLRLSQLEPYDLNGLVHINKKTGRMAFAPPANIPLEGDSIPKGYEGYLLFIDEALMADESVLKASMKLIYDRQVGEYNIHPKTFIVLASNRASDNAGANAINSALSNRVTHLPLLPMSLTDWMPWASSEGIDERILAFLKGNEEYLSHFDPSEDVHATPRSWTALSKQIKKQKDTDNFFYMLSEGNLGTTIATAFYTYCKKLIGLDIDTMMVTGNIPEALDVQYYIATILMQEKKLKKRHIGMLLKLDLSISVLFVRERVKTDPSILKHKEIGKLLK